MSVFLSTERRIFAEKWEENPRFTPLGSVNRFWKAGILSQPGEAGEEEEGEV